MQVLSGHCHSPLYYSVVVAACSVHSSWWCSLSKICSRRTTAVITTILRRPCRPTVSRCLPGPGSSLSSPASLAAGRELAATNQTEELRTRPGPRLLQPAVRPATTAAVRGDWRGEERQQICGLWSTNTGQLLIANLQAELDGDDKNLQQFHRNS